MGGHEGAPITVLHVDDDPDFGALFKEQVERSNDRIRVTTAAGVDDAREELSGAIDCVVSDYQMPGEDGFDMFEVVREFNPELPFIMMTGRGSEEVAARAVREGVTDYVRKHRSTEQYELVANRVVNAVEQYRAQVAADARDQKLQRLHERITDAFVAVDTSGFVTYANPRAEELFDVPIHELLGGQFWSTVEPVADSPLPDRAEAALDGGESVVVEERFDAFDGWFEVRLYPDDDGLSVYFRDVTERKQRLLALERDRRRYAALIASAPVAIVAADAGSGEVVEANRAAAEMLGYAQDRLESMGIVDLHPDRERDRYAGLVREIVDREGGNFTTLADGRPIEVETAARERVTVEISARVVDTEDETILQAIYRDVLHH
jgi:PAS domain S-box-containing protein